MNRFDSRTNYRVTVERKDSSNREGELATVLFLIFLILKLTNVIQWDWLWVFSPIWILSGLYFVFVNIFIIIILLKNRNENLIDIPKELYFVDIITCIIFALPLTLGIIL